MQTDIYLVATQWSFSPKSFLTITADVSLEVSSLSITLVDSVHPKSAVENNLLFPTDLVSTISSCYDENGSYKYFHIRESYHSTFRYERKGREYLVEILQENSIF